MTRDRRSGARRPPLPAVNTLLAGLLAVAAMAGCATRGPLGRASPLFVCPGGQCYRFGPLDPSWKVVRREKDEMGFFNGAVGGVIQGNAACRDDAEAESLSSLTAHLLVGYTARSERCTELVQLAGREALHTVVAASLDGVPFVLDLYVVKRNGCIIDLSFAAPPSTYERGALAFRRFVDGFAPSTRDGAPLGDAAAVSSR